MSKYHIGKNGPGICKAKVKCRYGGETGKENHYTTQKEAIAAWAEREGFSTIPKNPLKKPSVRETMQKSRKRRENSVAFTNFQKNALRELNRELRRKDLKEGERKELNNLINDFKQTFNNNQVSNLLKNSINNSNDNDVVNARNIFKNILNGSLKDAKNGAKSFNEKLTSLNGEFEKIKTSKSFESKNEQYHKSFIKAQEQFNFAKHDEEIADNLYEVENFIINANHNKSKDEINGYAKAREILIEKSDYHVEDILSKNIVNEQLSDRKTNRFLSSGPDYDKVSEKIFNDVEKIKNSRDLDGLISNYQKDFNSIVNSRKSSKNSEEVNRYDQIAKAYDNFLPNLEKARDDLKHQEELKNALNV